MDLKSNLRDSAIKNQRAEKTSLEIVLFLKDLEITLMNFSINTRSIYLLAELSIVPLMVMVMILRMELPTHKFKTDKLRLLELLDNQVKEAKMVKMELVQQLIKIIKYIQACCRVNA